jgi:hypothetical protein
MIPVQLQPFCPISARLMALSDDIDKNRGCPARLRMSTSRHSFVSKSSNIRQTLPSHSGYHDVRTKERWDGHLHRARSESGGYPTRFETLARTRPQHTA